MANIIRKFPSSRMRETQKAITQPLNFIIGIILFSMALFFMFTQEVFGFRVGAYSVILGLSGVLSLWAGLSVNKKTVYVTNLILGAFFIVSGLVVTIWRFYDPAGLVSPGLADYSVGDIVFHLAIGLIFFGNAFYWNRYHSKSGGKV